MAIIRKIRTNFNSVEDVWLFISILLLVTVLPFPIKFLSLPTLLRILTPLEPKAHRGRNLETIKNKMVKFTDYIFGSNLCIYQPTCLKRSLVLYHFLRKAGFSVHICFGVRFPNKEEKNRLEGHAWLVYNGEVFLEKSIEMTKTYKVTYCFPELEKQTTQTALEKS
jgi:hypothetical protein